LQEAYGSVVEYFGENPKTTQPSMFFPTFGRLIKAFKVSTCGGFSDDVRPLQSLLDVNDLALD